MYASDPIAASAADVQQAVTDLLAEYQGLGLEEDKQDKEVSVHVLVRSAHVGFVIGKGGETINHIKTVTGAQASFDKQKSQSEALLGQRKCRLEGTLQAVATAAHLICGVVLRFGGVDQATISMVVAPEACGALVGKKGEHLASLRQSTNTKIQLEPQAHPALGGRLCVLMGQEVHDVVHAMIRICQMDSFSSVSNVPTMPPAMPAYGAPQYTPAVGVGFGGTPPPMGGYGMRGSQGLSQVLATALDFMPLGVPQHDFTDRQQVEVTILLPSEHTGTIIGKGGANVATLRSSTNTRLNIEREEATPGFRRVVLTAQLSGVARALHMLASMLAELSGTATLNLIVSENCGGLIGKGGANLKRLRETCRCQVTMEREATLSDGRRLTLSSVDPAHVTLAAYYALRTLHDPREER
mmetsp:Transcript_90406/g.242121  ORF Transcript_90406/g.242121 Transcript_90406/m.242121 type:complete len:412 (+) Transcript_90406:109-1344(+)